MSKNISYELHSLDSVTKHIKELAHDPNDLPTDDIILTLPLYYCPLVQMRKKMSSQMPIKDARGIALLICSNIPRENVVTLKRRADNGDADALLALGDCFMFGLKRQTRDPMLASNYYRDAADLNQPEAVIVIAHMCYLKIQEAYGYEKNSNAPIPVECQWSPSRALLEQMWHWLDKSIELGWITPFFFKQAQDAQCYKSWPLSLEVKRQLVKRKLEAEQEQRELEQSHKVGCYNPECSIKTQVRFNFSNLSYLNKCWKINLNVR